MGNTRKSGKEQYYTLPEVANKCVEIALKYYDGTTRILEPAGGTGQFIEALRKHCIPDERLVSYDIEPKHHLVEKQDFLEVDFRGEDFFTVSNPPFGRANSLSVKFFNKAAANSTHICFLIPISWRKWSIINRLDDSFHLIEDVEMPDISFYNDNGPIEGGYLKTVFQVWERRNEKRKKIVVEDRGYLTNSTPEQADIAITFFGHSCGRIETEFDRIPNSTKKYFKVKDDSVIEALRNLDYNRFSKNTAYVKALSIMEINYLLNQYYDQTKNFTW